MLTEGALYNLIINTLPVCNYYLNFLIYRGLQVYLELAAVKCSLVLLLYGKSFVCFALLVTCLEIKFIVLDM